jgi:hypothetical protein
MPAVTLAVGDLRHGFTVRTVTPLPEMFLIAYELEHAQSGARMIHLHADDSENLFSVNFPTPPADDTGLPHILEHSVLSGSKRFPVRDPFFEMVKMSMATFINAMTGKDCTFYPICSNVRADLFNLAEVYFDAVFHPLLSEETFKREGHHLCPAKPEEPTGALAVNGIVYNEMKAHYSRPESRVWRDTCRAILPDTSYGHDSGGDPAAIPSLTYAQFLEFHRLYYHPSNARIVCYGDIETEAFLSFLGPRLDAFERQSAKAAFTHQPRWTAPREVTTRYDVGHEDPSFKTFLQMAWLVPGGLDAEMLVLLHVLALVLFGDDAAPLKRAIIDSGLGQDLSNWGMMLSGYDGLFGVGIKGSEPERMGAFRELVIGTLRRLCADGIPAELAESAFLRYMYEVREVADQRPLRVAQDVVAPWILGGDPLLYLRMGGLLATCLRRWQERPAILTDLIREHLLENPHRLDLRLAPDAGWQARIDTAFAERMAQVRGALDDAQAEALARTAEELQHKAGTPNSAEALATLPQLARSDLPAAPVHIPTTCGSLRCGVPFLRNDVFANGVNYLALHVDLDGLDADLWAYLPFYVETVNKMGAAGFDYAAMARRVSASTGGAGCHPRFGEHNVDMGRTCKGLVFELKALDEQMDAALEVLADKLRAPDPRDKARLRDVVTQLLASMQSRLISAGPRTGLTQIMAGMSEYGYLVEQTGGLSLYRAVRALNDGFDAGVDVVLDAVLRIDAAVRNRRRMSISFTGGDREAETATSALDALATGLADVPLAAAPTGFLPFQGVPRLGFAGPMQVAHCAQVLPAPHSSHPDAPLLALGMAMLRVDYMISELRFKGNAYGASCAYASGAVTLSTYADPHIRRTLDVFAALPAYVRNVPWTEVEVMRGVLSSAKAFVRPIRPEDATYQALSDHVMGVTYAHVVRRYETLCGATAARVKAALLAVLEPGMANAPVAVVSSREKLESANRELGAAALTVKTLLE